MGIKRLLLPNPIGVWMKGLKFDIMLGEEVLVLAKTVEQFSLWKTAFSAALDLACWNTLYAGLDASCAGVFVITLDFPLLAKQTGLLAPRL